MKVIITENQLNLIMEQSMGGMVSPQTFAQASSDSAKGIANAISNLTKMDVKSFMEGLREFLESGAGVVIQVLLELAPGIGPFLNVAAWGALTVYDIMRGINYNKWNWFNILIDIAGVITTGPGGKYVKKLLGKVAKWGTGSLETFVSAIKKYAPEAFNYILKIIKSISGVVSKISGLLTNLLTKLGGRLKNTAIYKGVQGLKSSLSRIPEILTKIEKTFGKFASSTVEKGVNIGKHVASHHTKGVASSLAATALTGGK
jgi:hypothetical protein